MSLSRIIITVLASLVILGVAFFGYQNYLAPTPTPAPTPSGIKSSTTVELVSAEGVVVPARSVTLGFKVPGRVVQVTAREGDAVKAGDVLARLDDTLLQKQLAQAEAAVTLAQKQLAQLKAGGTPEQLAAAQAALNAAKANYDRVKKGPTADELAQLKANVDNAKAQLDQAQFLYDRAGGATNPHIGQTREALQLQQATNGYDAALAAYDNARAHPTAAELAAAQSQVQQAEEALARLTPTQQAIDVAQAQVASAQAALEVAKVQAPDYVLVAPFAGTIATKSVEAGQIAQPGVPAFVLGDLSQLQIETTDLAEVDAPRVKAGASVKITSDNFPGKTFSGVVARIAPLASDHRGDKVFKVTIDLSEPTDLKWGMTTNVEIVVGQR